MITLHFAGYQPERSVHTRALHVLQQAVAQRSGGELAIAVTENIVTHGCNAADLLAMVEAGTLDGCYFSSSYLASRVPALGVLDLPFFAPPRQRLFDALDGDLGALLAESVQRDSGFCIAGFWDNGLRHISNGVCEIRHPRDCRGLRIRTLDNAIHQAAFRSMGFEPVFVDVANLQQSVASRTVDAQENPLTNVVNFKLQTYHRHVSLTGHLSGVALVLANRRRIASLSTDLGTMLERCVKDSEIAQRKFALAEDTACMQLLYSDGIIPVAPDNIDGTAFRQTVASIVDTALGAIDLEVRLALRPLNATD